MKNHRVCVMERVSQDCHVRHFLLVLGQQAGDCVENECWNRHGLTRDRVSVATRTAVADWQSTVSQRRRRHVKNHDMHVHPFIQILTANTQSFVLFVSHRWPHTHHPLEAKKEGVHRVLIMEDWDDEFCERLSSRTIFCVSQKRNLVKKGNC